MKAYLRSLLQLCLERLDRVEQKSARAKKERWYRKEFYLPPVIIAVIAPIILFCVLILNWALSLPQILFLALFVLVMHGLLLVYLKREQKNLVGNDDAMALLAVVFFLTLIWIKVISIYSMKFVWVSPFLTPVSVAALLITLLLNSRLAMVMSFVVSLVFGLINGFSLPVVMVGAFGSSTMVMFSSKVRSAQHVARSGVIVGVIQVVVILFLAVLLGWERRVLTVSVVSGFLSGIIAAVFGLGVLPYLESFFSRISNLRLVELAAVNHPLLQKMGLEAPGTYHHSMIVASLAEDAANAIGANGLLCRVGAYFHDIGKMVKAEYFIENQGAFSNPHDQVSPSLSKLVITSHVKEGIALGKAFKLDQQIIDFIPQHHGTSKIEFFYQKALELEKGEDELGKEEVQEQTYRYPGPKPQSKEAGIVMMADSVEAASRSLEEPNHQRYKDVVHKIINKKLFDGQLDETPLTLRDLNIIAERFVATLTSVHHVRIPYPEDAAPAAENNPSANDES